MLLLLSDAVWNQLNMQLKEFLVQFHDNWTKYLPLNMWIRILPIRPAIPLQKQLGELLREFIMQHHNNNIKRSQQFL